MTPEEIKKRSRRAIVTQALLDGFMHGVYNKQREKKRKALAVVAQKNQTLRGSSAPCFLFNGVWYTSPHNAVMPRNTADIDRTLDPSLYAEVADVLEETFEAQALQAEIRTMLGGALDTCRTLACLKALVPEAAWNLSPAVEESLSDDYDTGGPLTQNERDLFRRQYNHGMEALKQLYMTELLLGEA